MLLRSTSAHHPLSPHAFTSTVQSTHQLVFPSYHSTNELICLSQITHTKILVDLTQLTSLPIVYPLSSETLRVFVEIDPDELKLLMTQGQSAIDAFGERVGPVVARRLGGTVKHWRDEQARGRHS